MRNFVFFILLACLVSCGVKRKKVEKEVFIEKETDTLFVHTTDKITDTLRIEIPIYKTVKPECDSLLNSEIRNVLSRLSAKKSSGKNNYGVYYDKYHNQLVTYANLRAKYDSIKSKAKVIYRDRHIYEEKPVPYVPRLFKIFALIGFVGALYGGFRLLKLLKFI